MKKENEVQQENIQKLIILAKENPTLRIIPMVNSEVVADDGYCYWTGSWEEAYIDEVYVSDERIYFKSFDTEELEEQYIDNYDEGHPTSEEHIKK